VGDEQDHRGHRDAEEDEAGDRVLVRGGDDPLLVHLAEPQPVARRGAHQAYAGEHRRQQRHVVDVPLEGRDVDPPLLKRHDEQEREQELDPRNRHAQLLQELLEVAVEPLFLALSPSVGLLRHGPTVPARGAV
jgi:hypothetical protein